MSITDVTLLQAQSFAELPYASAVVRNPLLVSSPDLQHPMAHHPLCAAGTESTSQTVTLLLSSLLFNLSVQLHPNLTWMLSC